MISFGAKYIKPAYVQKISFDDGVPRCIKVSCIELSSENSADVDAAFDVSEIWDTDEGYPERIALSMQTVPNKIGAKDRYFALTTQKNNFETPDPDKILAISYITTRDNETEVEYLQVRPSKITDYNKPYTYQKVGTAMLDLFKKLFFDKKIVLWSRPTAVDFYLKNGFTVEDELDPTRMSYKA